MRKPKDPCLYRGTEVLINREGIRDAAELMEFERLVVAQRVREGLPDIALTPEGYCSLHRHLFQDVYVWAGKRRTVELARNDDLFCLVAHIDHELTGRFAAIRADSGLRSTNPDTFAGRAGLHLCEVNAIHPFREGNGRTQRALLVVLGRQAGYSIAIQRIDPDQWNEASRQSFRTGDSRLMCEVVAGAMVAGGPPTPG